MKEKVVSFFETLESDYPVTMRYIPDYWNPNFLRWKPLILGRCHLTELFVFATLWIIAVKMPQVKFIYTSYYTYE
jgi:hypothetical protein